MGMEGPLTGQQEHRAEQRRRILAAAVACFSRDGFHGTSMQKICAEAGMSPGALYRYFPSKESLIGAIVEGERAERAQLMDALDSAPTLADGLKECLDVMLAPEMGLPSAALGPEVMAEAIRNEKMRDALEPLEEETRARIILSLEKARARGEVDPALDLETLNMVLNMIGDGLVLHSLLHPEWRLADRTEAITDLIQRMIAPRTTERDA